MFVAVTMHWTFQSMLYADPTERRFKLALDALLTAGGGLALSLWWPWQAAWAVAFLLAHTLNFLFNAHLCALSKDYGLVRHTYEEYQAYVHDFNRRAQQEPSIQHVALRGGLTHRSWSPFSDLDVRIYRRPGFANGLRACWFLLRERTRALLAWFPLDAYLRDDFSPPAHADQNELASALAKTAQISSGEQPAVKPSAQTDLFGRRDRASAHAGSTSTPTASDRPQLIYLRGAVVHDFGQTSYRIAYHLPEFGFETTLIQLGRRAMQTVEHGVKLVVLAAPNIPVLAGLWVNFLALRYLLQTPCDVLLCTPGMIFCAIVYKRLRPQTKLVIDVRSVPVEVAGWRGWLIEKVFQQAVRSSALDGLSAITDGTLRMIQDRFQGRRDLPTVIWPSGVDEELFDPQISGKAIRQQYGLQDDFVLMYHGSLTPTRGLDLVLQALSLLAAQGETRPRVVFLGKETDYQTQLVAQAAQLGIDDQVLFLPPVPHEAIPAYVAAADAGLDPLPDHPWWNYSSPMKVYEYLRMGKPVLASNILAHRNISDAILLVPESDPEALATAINHLMGLDPGERDQLTASALEAGANNTWRMRAKTLARYLQNNFLDGPTS